ncbi:flagellar basal body-associated FliL family protein [Microvirga alba]|uniref:Flagellar protein FliL n=1 Tax=Microvirga alba TaxID=2791025 RepID=A0A931BKI3_9HYPH|nr:flagellar basal body-associated FliL family protein [Microvirga alba]MBF9232616.1 flagellar basal body-associated FliL family protein [Microvirga alba]
MARKPVGASPSKSELSAKGSGRWLVTLLVLTVLAIITGGAFGLYMVATVEKAVDEKKKGEEKQASRVLTYSGDMTLKTLSPVVTNLAGSAETWIRIESSIVFANGSIQSPDVLASEIRQDILAYLRTLSLPQIEGASGLQHLREDLNERAQMRSKGLVRELIIETLVVQ